MFEILNDYLKECNEIENEVLNSLSCEEIENIYHYGCCGTAPCSYIFYYQTNAFFDKYSSECLEILQQTINECYIEPRNFNFTKNDIVWLCVEKIVNDFMNYYEENNEYEEEEEDE